MTCMSRCAVGHTVDSTAMNYHCNNSFRCYSQTCDCCCCCCYNCAREHFQRNRLMEDVSTAKTLMTLQLQRIKMHLHLPGDGVPPPQELDHVDYFNNKKEVA